MEILKAIRRNIINDMINASRRFVNDLELPVNVLHTHLISFEINEDEKTIYYGIKAEFDRMPPKDDMNEILSEKVDECCMFVL